ncbi:MAG: DNA primase [Gammaproteobacteria bacterium]|nr:DNA primase [Gammaproteobacteria bacterium]
MSSRIPQTFIDDLLSRVDIVDVIDRRVPLKKAGREYKACCPFHGEKTPSFTVSQQKQFYHCFGCGAHGTAISFLMQYENFAFPEAVRELADSVGLAMPVSEQTPANAASAPPQLFDLMEKAAQYYRHQLKGSERAIAYLKGRGLTGQTVSAFEIGYAPDGWHHLANALAGSNSTIKQQLEQGGMLIKRDNSEMYDRFRDRIMFPIRDRRGRTIGFGGRILDKGEPKYLNSPETPLFHKGKELYGLYQARQANRELTQLIVVEGYMDVVALAQQGISYAVATLGTAITEAHLALLMRHCHKVIFCFDGDRAGRQAAWRAVETSLPKLSQGLELKFLLLPDGEDPDTMVQKIGRDGFENLLEKAQAFSQFFFENLLRQADIRGLDGQAKLLQLCRPLLEKVEDKVVRQLMIARLAELINMPSQQLQALLDGQTPTTAVTTPPAEREPKKPWQPRDRWNKTRDNSLQGPAMSSNAPRDTPSPVRHAISLLLHRPALAEQVSISPALQALELPGMRLLLDLLELLHHRPNMSTGAVLEHWRHTKEGVSLNKLATQEPLLTEDQVGQEFLDTITVLEKKSAEQRLDQLLKKSTLVGLDEQEKSLLNRLLRER